LHTPLFLSKVRGMETPLEDQLFQEYLNHPRTKLHDAWTILLNQYPWEWFVTLTFAMDVHPEEADKKLRLWISMINRKLHGPRWFRKPGGGVQWVFATERQKQGRIHFHGVMVGVKDLRRLTWMDKWEELDKKAGFARIEPIKVRLGVCNYVCKYVAKDGNIEISENLQNLSQDLFAGMERL